MDEPDEKLLASIVRSRLGEKIASEAETLIREFLSRRQSSALATDQLLNALFLIGGSAGHKEMSSAERQKLIEALLRELTSTVSV